MNKHNKLNIDHLSNLECLALALMPLGWEIIHQDNNELRARDLENDWLFEDSLLKVWYAYGDYQWAVAYSDEDGITNMAHGSADSLRKLLEGICALNIDAFERAPESQSPHDFEPLDSDDDNFAALTADFQANCEMLRRALERVNEEEDVEGYTAWLKDAEGYTAWPPGTIAQVAGVPLFNNLITPDPAKVYAAEQAEKGVGYFKFPDYAILPKLRAPIPKLRKPISLEDCLNEIDPEELTAEELREFIRLGFFDL